MPLFSLLYVSQSRLPEDAAERAVQDIVEISLSRNRALGVTGALIFTGTRFAQLLEGRRGAVEEVMNSIRRDACHHDLVVLDQRTVAGRRFAGWSMAYSGSALFVDRIVARAREGGPRSDGAVAELLELMQTFAGRDGS